MTRDDYGNAYQTGFIRTVRFLFSKGLTYDSAHETAQAAWTTGWERLEQLRNPAMINSWMNSIALNIYRNVLRKDRVLEALPELSTSPKVSLTRIDLNRVLQYCKQSERQLLKWYYVDGYKAGEIARRQGCTETAVRVRLLRARRSVRKQFECQAAGSQWAARSRSRVTSRRAT